MHNSVKKKKTCSHKLLIKKYVFSAYVKNVYANLPLPVLK